LKVETQQFLRLFQRNLLFWQCNRCGFAILTILTLASLLKDTKRGHLAILTQFLLLTPHVPVFVPDRTKMPFCFFLPIPSGIFLVASFLLPATPRLWRSAPPRWRMTVTP
jgi:hypothetical protein